MGCSRSVMLNMQGVRCNRARLKRASEISRMREPNGAFSLCVYSHARVLLAFSRTLLTRAGIPKILKKERSGAVGGGGSVMRNYF